MTLEALDELITSRDRRSEVTLAVLTAAVALQEPPHAD